jgi:hypothetical protein
MYDAWSSKSSAAANGQPSSSGHSEEQGDSGAEPQVGRLGSGSDYTPFLQHLGIPSMSVGYSGEYPVYHSQYDSFFWVDNFGDERHPKCPTGFCRHAAMATYVGALVMRLADDKILPFNYTHYAIVMRGYVNALAGQNAPRGLRDAPPAVLGAAPLAPLYGALAALERATAMVSAEMAELQASPGRVCH